MLKICVISDLHGFLPTVLPQHSLLLIAGDLVSLSHEDKWYYEEFIPWLKWCNKEYNNYIILIGGNHDFMLQDEDKLESFINAMILEGISGTYLQDEVVNYEGINIYGSPWNTGLPSWAFYCTEKDLQQQFTKNIPYKCDIVLSHSPPYCFRDNIIYNGCSVPLGSKALYNTCIDKKVKYVVCGHIHEGYGIEKINAYTTVVNCSIKDKMYRPVNKPIIIEI